MFVELKFEFKFTNVVKFNDFRDKFRDKFRCMFFKKKKIFTKIELFKRFKRMKNNQILKKKFKKFKKRKISFDIDNFENENEKFKNAKFKNKKLKKINKINSNHESIKSKNIRMYR